MFYKIKCLVKWESYYDKIPDKINCLLRLHGYKYEISNGIK